MADNGSGGKINIPSVFIYHEEGENLKVLYQNTNKSLVVKVNFPSFKSENVSYSFYNLIWKRKFFVNCFIQLLYKYT